MVLLRVTAVVALEAILTRLLLWKAITQSTDGEISDGYTPQFLYGP
jgi:hypothetical protein